MPSEYDVLWCALTIRQRDSIEEQERGMFPHLLGRCRRERVIPQHRRADCRRFSVACIRR